jgi:hypothetical protein
MHLFGSHTGPHLAHFHVWHRGGSIELDWEVRNSPPLRWRVLRSERDFASSADPAAEEGQVLLMEGAETHVTDQDLVRGTHYFYTVFAQEGPGDWHRQVHAKVAPKAKLSWHHADLKMRTKGEADSDYRGEDPSFIVCLHTPQPLHP